MSLQSRRVKKLSTKTKNVKTTEASKPKTEDFTLSNPFDSFVSLSVSSQDKSKNDSDLYLKTRDEDKSLVENEVDEFAFPEEKALKPSMSDHTTALSEMSPSLSPAKRNSNVILNKDIQNLGMTKKLCSSETQQSDNLNESSLIFQDKNIVTRDQTKVNSQLCVNAGDKNSKNEKKVDLNDSLEDVIIPKLKTGDSASVMKSDDNNEPEPNRNTNQCPICLKTVTKYVNHMKSCAAKNKMNTQQLLDALKLHKKQLAERKELGLDIPMQSYRARVSPKRAKANEKKGPVDANLQLALALSASLRSAEEAELIQEAEVLQGAGLCEEARQRLTTLEKFGFASAIAVPPQSRGLAKIKPAPSLLLKRSNEERERIVTEKVAIVLISEEEDGINLETFETKEPKLRSKYLKEVWNEETQLWSKAQCGVEEQRGEFYVLRLSEFVTPSTAEVGAGLRTLSQLPGRLHTPEKEDVFNFYPTEPGVKSEGEDQCTDVLISPPVLQTLNDSCDRASTVCNSPLVGDRKGKLADDWRRFVGQSELSDVNVSCRGGKTISAHKLVFHVRCPSILNLVTDHGGKRDVVMLDNCSETAVLAFLEFVYSGSPNRILDLDPEDCKQVQVLTDKLDYSELKSRLRTLSAKASCFDNRMKKVGNKQESFQNYFDKDNELLGIEKLSPARSVPSDIGLGAESVQSLKSNKNNVTFSQNQNLSTNGSQDSSIGRLSPDMFGESNVACDNTIPKDDRDDIDILASLIGKSTPWSGNKVNSSSRELSPEKNISLVSSPLKPDNDTERKRKASTCSYIGDEETSLFKKQCTELPKNPPTENKVVDDVFDLTQSSNSSVEDQVREVKKQSFSNSNKSTDEIFCLDDGKDFENEFEDSLAGLTQKNLSAGNSMQEVSSNALTSPLSEGKMTCQDYVDPVWDGFDNGDNYCLYNYSPAVTTVGSTEKWSEKKLSQHLSKYVGSPESFNASKANSLDKSCRKSLSSSPKTSPEVIYISSSPRKLTQTTLYDYSPKSKGSSKKRSHRLSISDTELELSDISKNPSPKLKRDLSSQFEPCASTSNTVSSTPIDFLKKSHHFGSTKSLKSSPTYSLENSTPKNDSLKLMQRLLEDSLEINDSVFANADALVNRPSGSNGRQPFDSPTCSFTTGQQKKTRVDCLKESENLTVTPSPELIVSDKVTPLPDYSAMKTPSLKRELSKFGLKPSLGRRKAKLLLRYIYDETHPFVPDPGGLTGDQPSVFKQPVGQPPRSPSKSPRKTKAPADVNLVDSDSDEEFCSQKSTSSVSSTATLPEESFCEFDDVLTQETSPPGDLKASIRNMIKSDAELHRKVLMYEPIYLDEFIKTLKANGIKSKVNDVMDFLDEQCITFRTNSWKATNEKRRQKNVRKKVDTAGNHKEPKKRKNKVASPKKSSPLKSQPILVKKRGRPRKNQKDCHAIVVSD